MRCHEQPSLLDEREDRAPRRHRAPAKVELDHVDRGSPQDGPDFRLRGHGVFAVREKYLGGLGVQEPPEGP